jgi:hypothetical protein
LNDNFDALFSQHHAKARGVSGSPNSYVISLEGIVGVGNLTVEYYLDLAPTQRSFDL